MKSYTSTLAIATLACSFAFSEEKPKSTDQHHRVYLGPDIFWDHFHEKSFSKEETSDTKINSLYGGLKIGYDYLKPETFYFGTDGLVAIGRSSTSKSHSDTNSTSTVNGKSKSSPLFANVEQRYGYTFQSPISSKSTITPFIGIGWYYIRPQFDNNFHTNWFYGAAGLRVNQQFSDNFDVGFNIKAMHAFAGNIKNFWGYEAALPLTWHVGTSKKWDIQFQPYLLKLDADSRGQILGARLLAGYSF